jgi:streptogramin lyase
LKLASFDDPAGTRGELVGETVTDEIPGGGKFATPMFDEDGDPMGPGRRGIEVYKNEIIDYLTRVRGPQSPAIKVNPLPRPAGEETNLVVTEYDLPPEGAREFGRLDPATGHITLYKMAKDGTTQKNDHPDMADYENRNGTDWSMEIGPHQEGHGAHDVTVDAKTGYVYFGGQGLVVDQNGVVWSGAAGVTRFDSNTETFKHFPHPEGHYNAGKEIDPKGHLWMPYFDGAWEFDPATGTYTRHLAQSRLGRSYGLTVDREGTAWFAQIAIDKIGYIDAETGKAGEVVLPPIDDEIITPKDRAVGPGWTATHPLYMRGPRRLDADHLGDSVWVCNFFAGILTKIDIHTKQFVDYKLPGPYRFAFPYFPVTDKNHVVWFSLANADAEGKFDPVTEKFTFYPLPTRGHNARHSDINMASDTPEIWIPYTGSNKIARMQFRKN